MTPTPQDTRPDTGTVPSPSGTIREGIVRALSAGPASGNRLVRLLGGRRTLVYLALRELQAAGRIVRDGHQGRGGRGSRYRLAGGGEGEA